MTNHPLAQNWHTTTLLCFAAPTIFMMLFMGLYTLVDILFAARFVDTDALSAINIVCPVTNLIVGLGTMLATGGNAILSRKMGAGMHQEVKEDFTLLILAGTLIGVCLFAIGTLSMTPLLQFLGASPRLWPYAKDYLGLMLLFVPASMLQTLFASLFVTAGKPTLDAILSISAGIANIVLEYTFIVICNLGIRGAALGTGMGMLLPSLGGWIIFSHKKGILYFTKPILRLHVLTESCLNDASELVSQCATAVTTLLFNRTMMQLAGEYGVAAMTIIYSQFMLQTLFIGYGMGIAPITGYNHGSNNHTMQRRIMRTSLALIGLSSLLLFALTRWHTAKLIACFATPDTTVYTLATQGFTLFTWSLLFCGTNIFTSAAFTALSSGRLSASLSFLRTFGLLAPFILILPNIANTTGLWLAIPLAESIMWVISVGCLVCQQKRYRY